MDNKIFLYGAGWIGKTALYKLLKLNIPIWRVLDNNKALWGTKLMGVEISSPSVLRGEKNCKIIVSTDEEKYQVIRQELISLGYEENVDFFLYYDKFSSLLMAKMKKSQQQDGLMLASGFSGNQVYIDHEQQRVYRVIQDKDRDWLLNIYDVCHQNNILGDVIINTWLSEENFGGKLVFEHEYIPVEISSVEWSPLMIREAALFVVELMEKCAKVGLSPIDIHQGNIMFYNGKFTFSDFDGLEENAISTSMMERFFSWYINRLLFAAHNSFNIYESFIPQKNYKDVAGYLPEEEQTEYQEIKGKCVYYVENDNVGTCCELLKKYIEGLDLYRDNIHFLPKYSAAVNCYNTNKRQYILKLLSEVPAHSLLEVVCGNEIFSLSNCDQYKTVVIAGLYHEITDYVFECIKKESLKNIYPVRMDIAAPTLGVYRDEFIADGPIKARSNRSAVDRLKSECVLAIGVVEYYVLNCGLDFEEILGQLALYSDKWVVVDFDEGNEVVRSILADNDEEWYTRDYFEKSLDRYFYIDQAISCDNGGYFYLVSIRA